MAMSIVRDLSVKVKYYSGGELRKHILDRLGKHKHESTKKARIYYAIPPITGWIGGLPEVNGWKPRKG